MPLVNRTDITDPVTPAKLEVVLKPIRILQWNGKIDEQNFKHESSVSFGIPLHAGSMIRNVNDLVDSAKTFDGRSIYTETDVFDTLVSGAAYAYFNNNTDNNEKDLFTVHSKVACALYKQEKTVRDIEFKLSYSRDDIKSSFRTRKEVKSSMAKAAHWLKDHAKRTKAAPSGVWGGGEKDSWTKQKSWNRTVKRYNELAAQLEATEMYEFISLSQSIEVEMPKGYEFDSWEVFGDLDWGWLNEVGDEKMAVGVLYIEFDHSRDDFAVFKLSILFDQDVALSADDYVLAAGKLQYRVKRYA